MRASLLNINGDIMTKSDLIKKYETNIKSAQSTYALAGILALIYIVRYFFSGNFNFYFSLFSTEFLLKKSQGVQNPLPYIAAVSVICIFYIIFGAIAVKNDKGLSLCLVYYSIDFLLLIANTVTSFGAGIDKNIFIDIIIHFFVILFLVVGAYSQIKMKNDDT